VDMLHDYLRDSLVLLGPYDTYSLASHKNMPGQLYSAAGDGYFESYDYGQIWKLLTR